MPFLFAGLGLLILVLAGDALVRGAVNLSLRLGVPALIVSLTIVAFGTSAPELLISIGAIIEDVPGIALGNVVGSNIANVLLVLGAPALISGLNMANCETRESYLLMMGASLLFVVICFLGPITWVHGVVLLAFLAFTLWGQARDAMAHRRAEQAIPEEEVEGADPDMGWPRIVMFLVLGLIGLPLGADILVDNATIIALTFGISDTVIGLTLVAIGTSLPELATTVAAAIRRQADVALGNVIGSNMFNLLAIIGLSSFVGDIPVDTQFLTFDLWVMLGASVLLAPFVFWRWNMTKRWGIALLAAYAGYLLLVIL